VEASSLCPRRSPTQAVRASRFSGGDQRDWVQPEWDHDSGHVDGRAERDLQRSRSRQRQRKCEWQCHNYFERIQSDLDHPVVGHGSCAGGTGIESDQSQLRQRDRGKQSVSVRDGHQHRRFERHDFSGGDQRDWVQPEWDHDSGHVDGRQSATFTVTFTPASAGSVSGNVTITSNASNPTLTIPLSGTGVAPGHWDRIRPVSASAA